MGPPTSLFRFSQLELPWALGPPDGRYLLRTPTCSPGSPPSYVLVLRTLGAPERRHLRRRRQHHAEPEPEPQPVRTTRATVIDVSSPFADPRRAMAWLEHAGEDDLGSDLAILNRALHAYRLVIADPYTHSVSRRQALVARIGFGGGEQVADGLWAQARELVTAEDRQRRTKVLHPQARLAAVLGGRERLLVCEELALRGRIDLDHGRDREAALQVMIALDAALAELSADAASSALADRLGELRGQRDALAVAGQAALAGPLAQRERAAVEFTLERIEAALRARAVANA